MTKEFAIEYIQEECEDCPQYRHGECLSDSNCFEVKRMAIKALKQLSCEDAVSRNAVIDEIRSGQSYITKINPTGALEHLFDKENKALEEAVERIEELPSVTPKQETAHWKWLRGDVVMCDKCGYVQTLVDFDEDKRGKNYCPSCGRKMVEE